jgi:hypothetical protein
LIVGADDIGRLVAEKIGRHPEYRLELLGFVDAESYVSGTTIPMLGEPADPRVRCRDTSILERSGKRSEKPAGGTRRSPEWRPFIVQLDKNDALPGRRRGPFVDQL